MQEETYTVNGASDALGRDRRVISKALRTVPPDSRDEQGRPRWRLPTIAKALSALDRAGSGSSGASSALADEVEAIAAELEEGLEKLRTAPDVETARALARSEVGRLVGALDK